MVHMTCCDSRYATVRESMNHTCPTKGSEKVATLPIVSTECEETTVHMERHAKHMYPGSVDGVAVRFACRGF